MRTQLYLQSNRKLQGEDVQQRRLLISNKSNYQVLIDRGCSAVKQIIYDVTSNIYDSFVNLRSSKKSPKQMYTNRKPSRMTIQLIKQIHNGFDPLEMSANRWMLELEDQRNNQKKDVDQMLFNQELLKSRNSQVKPNRKKIFTIIQQNNQNPKPFEMMLWKIAEDNIVVSKKKLEEIQEKQKWQNLKSDILNSNQVKPTEEKLNEINEIGQINQLGAAVAGQKNITEQPQPNLVINTQNKDTQSGISNKQIFNQSIKPKLTSSLIIENKQPELNKDKPLDAPKKIDNPFLGPVCKPLSLADLHGFKTDIFGNKNTQTNLSNNLTNNNYQSNSQLPFPIKTDPPQWLNIRNRQKNCKVQLKPELFNNVPKTGLPNIQNTPSLQVPAFPMQQSNPFSQPKPLSIVKKGLAPGQISSATIFKSNQILQNQPLSKEVSQFSQAFSSGATSNERVKQMFSNQATPSAEPQGLFDMPPTARTNTEKKGRNNRRSRKEKQTRIN